MSCGNCHNKALFCATSTSEGERHGSATRWPAALHLGPDEVAFSLSSSTALPMSLVGIPSPWASSCLCTSNHLDSSVLDQGFENICRENELGDSRDHDFLGRRAGFIHQIRFLFLDDLDSSPMQLLHGPCSNTLWTWDKKY